MRAVVVAVILSAFMLWVAGCGSDRRGEDDGAAGANSQDGGADLEAGRSSGRASGSGGQSGDAGSGGRGGSRGQPPGGSGGAGGVAGAAGESGAGGQAGSAGSAGTAGSGAVIYRLTIEFLGDGTGEVHDRFSSFVCDQNCERTLPEGTEELLHALPVNGTDSYFGGFGGDCSGITECTLVMDGDKHVTVDFRIQQHNFVFLSSTTPSHSRSGGAARFDDDCNELATAAGINNATNDGYVAWVSDPSSLARDRLGAAARGFVRLDGKPVADSIAALLAEGEIYHSIRVDDTGVEHDDVLVLTGTLADGLAAPDNCDDYRSEASGFDLAYGTNAGGPIYWTEAGVRPCNLGMRIFCFGKTKSTPLVLEPAAGKLIYLSEPVTLGSTTPDAACSASAPSGAGSVHALTTYTDVAGASLLIATALYVRPDGLPVGTGAEIVEAAAPGVQATVDNYLRTGIWQTGAGDYADADLEPLVWIGDSDITRGVGTGTCAEWTNPGGGSARVGDYRTSGAQFWNLAAGLASPSRDCGNAYRFYCVEE